MFVAGVASRMDKSARLVEKLEGMEREYRAVLTRALTDCAAGCWGIFGQNEPLRGNENPARLDELRDLAGAIDRLRARLGDAPFPLHQEFEAARGPVDPNAPGEPKQAKAWLKTLAITQVRLLPRTDDRKVR